MEIREHHGFAHGLRHGEAQDINCASCIQEDRTLSLTDAGLLADLIRAVERNAKMSYYPLGTDSADHPLKVSLRCFAHEGGGLWFDKDGDVREAYVHGSGYMEHWFKVRDLMAAIGNIDGRQGLDKPIAVIDPVES